MTALYGLLFLLIGAVLLGITAILLNERLNDQAINTGIVYSAPATQAIAPDDGTAVRGTPDPFPDAAERLQFAEKLQADFRERTMASLLQQGTLALSAVGVVGVWLAWGVAGRTLRPLQQITTTAQRVAHGNLHERIGLDGPHDELRDLADTFDDMLSRLDAAFHSQKRFVANASHELRTPLSINRTLIEVALSHPDVPDQTVRLGTQLLDVNNRHERLIEGLLLLATSEHEIADPTIVRLDQVTQRLITAGRPAAGSAGVEIRPVIEPARVIGDAVLLERLIQNLLTNAVNYNIACGVVGIRCEELDGTVALTIWNTGPLIDDHEIDGLYEPFRRLTDRIDSVRGSGLGLSIVRSIAAAHHARITTTARRDGGLETTVRFPPADATAGLTMGSRTRRRGGVDAEGERPT
ncbi:sensor histidine kinase [Actinoplanes xinjiangensis]|uniref:sensor histidine kinase n=1 Tax=Actinoplanes xinjiangensis TaxID=512350 RepID=UPI00130E6715|nr:ATP-binding protein [Actinoplanes xinjiangensis]